MATPAGHMLSGIIIAALPARNVNELNYKRLILGAFFAAAPDLDMLLVFSGVDYIDAHRTFSHSVVWVAMISFAIYLWNYVWRQKSGIYQLPNRLICACLLCHIFLDLLGVDHYGPKGLMLFWPISYNFYHLDFNILHSIVDASKNFLPLQTIISVLLREILLIGLAGAILLWLRHSVFRRLGISFRGNLNFPQNGSNDQKQE